MLLQCQPTLPSGLADARLVLAATSVRGAAVSQAVGDVAGFPLPVGLTVTVHRTGGVPHATLAAAGAVVGTRIQPRKEETRGGNREGRETMIQMLPEIYTLNKTSGTPFNS